ncbi:NAC transcription factor 29-like [Syzygium oleosum]|uniref:NAC transcription factor 29-like n=1 Tax=Syzygium oleosum TaxID=219896 RepID=UPI0024BB3E51|nr:NAC transcription factor 29-like [Syzygium oleosum]
MAGQIIPANNDQNLENMGLMPVLPPGFRFFPSDEEIFRYYLVNKNDRPNPNLANHFDHNVIKELDVYGYSPSELSENPYFEYGPEEATRHWYFYTAACGPAERQRGMRTVNRGFWLMRGRGNDAVVGGGGGVLGTKCCFVFYMGTSVHNAVRTDWTMHEFALPDHAQASFMLYRLSAKPWTGNSSLSARNDGVLTYEAAPGGNREDVVVSEIHYHVPEGQIPAPVCLNQTIYLNSRVNHHHGSSDGAGNSHAD